MESWWYIGHWLAFKNNEPFAKKAFTVDGEQPTVTTATQVMVSTVKVKLGNKKWNLVTEPDFPGSVSSFVFRNDTRLYLYCCNSVSWFILSPWSIIMSTHVHQSVFTPELIRTGPCWRSDLRLARNKCLFYRAHPAMCSYSSCLQRQG